MGGFYQILADIPKKPQNPSHPNRPQQSASPAGTLDSGHGSEQTCELRESNRSPNAAPSSNQSSPRHSPRRIQASLGRPSTTNDHSTSPDNPWLNELGSFELQNGQVSVKAPPQREIYAQHQKKNTNPAFKHTLDKTLNQYTVSPELAAAMAIEEEENQRELTERIRKKEIIEQDEYTESQISRSPRKAGNQHWM